VGSTSRDNALYIIGLYIDNKKQTKKQRKLILGQSDFEVGPFIFLNDFITQTHSMYGNGCVYTDIIVYTMLI